MNWIDTLLNKISLGINKILHLDPSSKKRLQILQDKVVTIEIKPVFLKFQCHFSASGMFLQLGAAEDADAVIVGTAIPLMTMMFSKNRQQFFKEDVSIQGDVELAQQVIALFDQLSIDWEEQLSHVVGDVPAYHIQQTVTAVIDKMQTMNLRFTEDVRDYMQEEVTWLPSRLAINDLFSDIDECTMATERLTARVSILKNILKTDETLR